jgi:hypothetical protein
MNPSPRSHAGEELPLSVILEQLSAQTGLSFISDFEDISVERFALSGSEERVLDELCRRIQGRWTRKKSGIVTLVKDYTRGTMRPQVPQKESQKLTTQVRDALQRRSSFDRQLSEGYGALYLALSEPQRQMLEQRGLTAGELTAPQQALLFRVMNSTVLREVSETWQQLDTYLNQRKDFYIDFTVQDAIFPEDRQKGLKQVSVVLIAYKERARNQSVLPIAGFMIEKERL